MQTQVTAECPWAPGSLLSAHGHPGLRAHGPGPSPPGPSGAGCRAGSSQQRAFRISLCGSSPRDTLARPERSGRGPKALDVSASFYFSARATDPAEFLRQHMERSCELQNFNSESRSCSWEDWAGGSVCGGTHRSERAGSCVFLAGPTRSSGGRHLLLAWGRVGVKKGTGNRGSSHGVCEKEGCVRGGSPADQRLAGEGRGVCWGMAGLTHPRHRRHRARHALGLD